MLSDKYLSTPLGHFSKVCLSFGRFGNSAGIRFSKASALAGNNPMTVNAGHKSKPVHAVRNIIGSMFFVRFFIF